jgi:hypothetical protein
VGIFPVCQHFATLEVNGARQGFFRGATSSSGRKVGGWELSVVAKYQGGEGSSLWGAGLWRQKIF